MPVIILERIPLPSLRTYTCISVGLFSLCVYYALHMTSSPNWRSSLNDTKAPEDLIELADYEPHDIDPGPASFIQLSGNFQKLSLSNKWKDVFSFMMQESLCTWSTLNMAYCCLILFGTFIQNLVFGELRVSEQQHVKDRFWNFIFYKFIFVFGVINVQLMEEMVLWCSWFSVLGFMHLLAQLGKDRFEYLSFSPGTSRWSHARLVALLVAIYLLSGLMFGISIVMGYFVGFSLFAFMAAECVQLNLRTLHLLIRYGMHFHEMRNMPSTSSSTTSSWEQKGPVIYYTELVLELTVLLVDLAHHIHMLLWGNFFLSMATLVICLQIRYIFNEIQRRIRKHRNYLWVLAYMEKNYPMATVVEITEHSDNCSICWEKMETARKLPCSHLFHETCLLSWLEQDTSCPKCRSILSMQPPVQMDDVSLRTARMMIDLADNPQPVLQPAPQLQNHFFHFDGSRYVSWLPSFSVEVTHTTTLGVGSRGGPAGPAMPTNTAETIEATSQLEAMARHVQQMFPQYALQAILDDLRVTRSPEFTIENILEGRVLMPVVYSPPPPPSLPVLSASSSSSSYEENGSSGLQFPHRISDEDMKEEPFEMSSEFSSDASNRHLTLVKRKERLILAARRRYLEKHKDVKSQSDVMD